MTTDDMLTEALQIGSQSASRANLYMTTTRDLMLDIEEAVRLLESGTPEKARDLLREAQRRAARQVTRHTPTADFERVVDHFCNGEKAHQREFVMALLRELGGQR